MSKETELYGQYVFTHGWRRVLTVMSPAGATAVRKALRVDNDIEVNGGDGRLVQLHEKRAGALERIVAIHNIKILDKAEWDARKARFGDAIYD